MMPEVRWSEIHPDPSKLLARQWFKVFGVYRLVAPANATLIRASAGATGGQGELPGGNAAFAHAKRSARPAEAFTVQVGQCGTAGAAGDSWVKRTLTGEVIVYADRGHGSGQEGQAAFCIGDIVRGGLAKVAAGGDGADMAPFGFGGRWAARGAAETRSAQPGGGGWGAASFPDVAMNVAGMGLVVVEFYGGDPGVGY